MPMSVESTPIDERVQSYLTDRARLGRDTVVALSGDASTRRYFRLVDGAASAILALYPEPFDPKELSFVVVRDLMAEWGLPVPRILDHDGARGILLLEDLGDLTLQDALAHTSVAQRTDFYAE